MRRRARRSASWRANRAADAVGDRRRRAAGGDAPAHLVAGQRDGLRARARRDRAVYVGFAVADGRPKVIAVESSVTFAFVVVAAAAVTGSPWLLVAGLAGHGLKDLWQHRTHFVAGTRWWPPFCMVVDWVVAAIIAVEIAAGMHFG